MPGLFEFCRQGGEGCRQLGADGSHARYDDYRNKAAINPYSIAVAPDSSRKNSFTSAMIISPRL